MFQKLIALVFLTVFVYLQAFSQSCTTLGQTPGTAFPVCGTAVFAQSTVPYCTGRAMPGVCSQDGVADVNPFWYKFTCYTAGSLGFFITPNDLKDDYDWELFDITGHDANEVYTNTSLFVACNWSGNTGVTGASSSGTSLENCAGNGYSTFSSMPALKQGHTYLLLLSHFTLYTPSQNGYQLSFGGGTASITDTLLPDISNVKSSCDATQVMVKLNKKMKCKSLAANGSDFSITPAVSNIIAASGVGCNTSFDMDSLILTLDTPLSPGDYTVSIKNGTDANTLLDNCDRNITPGKGLPVTILPLAPTPMDSLTTVSCAPSSLQLVFRKNMRCNSIAPDGSDFVVNGPSPVSVIAAAGSCTNEVSNVINITLSGAIVKGGIYQVKLLTGTDGNTVVDNCGQETPAGSTINFTTADTVSAAFTYATAAGCRSDTIMFSHTGGNGINRWLWRFNSSGTSNLQNPVVYFGTSGTKQVTLNVSNGVCADSVAQTISPGNELIANFETNDLLCPEDAATFINNSVGNITAYHWDFGNGTTNLSRNPPALRYPVLAAEKKYTIRLIVANDAGCFDTAYNPLKVLKSCYIAVPNAFTPNGDGLNDYLYPVNAYKADSLEFSVYNRLGQLVFHTNDWTQKWDGKIKDYPQDSGIYVWLLKYTHHDTRKNIFQKGSTILIR